MTISSLPRSLEQARRRAYDIKDRMKELGSSVQMTHAYEMLAAAIGIKDWPTLRSDLEDDAPAAATSPALTPTSETSEWTPVLYPPTSGGPYVVGGYVEDGTLPRRFERGFANLVLTVTGPEWRLWNKDSTFPIEYWVKTPPHPEFKGEAKSTVALNASLDKRHHDLVEAELSLEEVRRAVFGDIGDEPDVYKDYDRLISLQNKMTSAIARVRKHQAPQRPAATPAKSSRDFRARPYAIGDALNSLLSRAVAREIRFLQIEPDSGDFLVFGRKTRESLQLFEPCNQQQFETLIDELETFVSGAPNNDLSFQTRHYSQRFLYLGRMMNIGVQISRQEHGTVAKVILPSASGFQELHSLLSRAIETGARHVLLQQSGSKLFAALDEQRAEVADFVVVPEIEQSLIAILRGVAFSRYGDDMTRAIVADFPFHMNGTRYDVRYRVSSNGTNGNADISILEPDQS